METLLTVTVNVKNINLLNDVISMRAFIKYWSQTSTMCQSQCKDCLN